MKWFNRGNDYPLSAEEEAGRAAAGVSWLLYAVLAAVVLITGAHAVLLVINTTASFTTEAETTGLFYAILNVIRVMFPVIVEIAAVGVGLGFIRSKWRAGQRTFGKVLELAWFLFAAANMVTFFALERGQELVGWQSGWVQYGLPLSALIVAALTYSLLKADPAHKRTNEEALAAEKLRTAEFNARNAVKMSDAMMTIHERRVWREEVDALAAQGYTPDEIAFMTAHIPDLADLAAAKAAKAEVAPPDVADAKVLDWLKAKLGKSAHSSDTADPTVIPLVEPGPGQGNGAPAPKLGAQGGSVAKDFR